MECIKCNTDLIVGENCTETQLKYSNYTCKPCRSNYDKKYQKTAATLNHNRYLKYKQERMDGHYSVYILPEEHYAGYTSSVHRRELEHRCGLKRNTSGMRVLYTTKNRDEALELEALLHDEGYAGRHHN